MLMFMCIRRLAIYKSVCLFMSKFTDVRIYNWVSNYIHMCVLVGISVSVAVRLFVNVFMNIFGCTFYQY